MTKLSKIKDKIDKTNKINDKKFMVFEGAFLILVSLLTLIFDIKLTDLTLLYLFPITLIILSLEYLVMADKNKALKTSNWIFLIIPGLYYLLVSLYVVITKNIDPSSFIVLLASTIIFKNIMYFLAFKEKKVFDYIRIVFMIILSILLIIFKDIVSEDLVLYLGILFIVVGIIKIIRAIIKK